jgi:hypothetical protein
MGTGLTIPADGEDLLELAQKLHPELKDFRYASDCIIARERKPPGRDVHMLFRRLRELLANERRAEAGLPPIDRTTPRKDRDSTAELVDLLREAMLPGGKGAQRRPA